MARRESTPPQRWLSGFGALDWRSDEREHAALLDALTRDRLDVEAVEREMEADARRSVADMHQDHERAERDELAEARNELSDFRLALTDARRRGGVDGTHEVSYDSRDLIQNHGADMLIQYLVRPGYAGVRTEEPKPGQFVYYIHVDWPRLRELAKQQGHPISL
jgi:hypothetical protein